METRIWQINEFQGTTLEYINYLETLVLHLSNGSPPCLPCLPRSSPPSPPSSPSLAPSDEHDEAIDSCDSFRFIPFNQKSIPPTTQSEQPRWEREIDKAVSVMTTKGWLSRRSEVGLSSEADIIKALDVMIHGKPQAEVFAIERSAQYRPLSSVIDLVRAFDTTTAALGIEKEFMKQMYNFRQFLSISLCCVALYNGEKRELVDKVMMENVSKSSEKNLARLRNGAIWVNRMMAELAGGHKGEEVDGVDMRDRGGKADEANKCNLGHLAYELFILCK